MSIPLSFFSFDCYVHPPCLHPPLLPQLLRLLSLSSIIVAATSIDGRVSRHCLRLTPATPAVPSSVASAMSLRPTSVYCHVLRQTTLPTQSPLPSFTSTLSLTSLARPFIVIITIILDCCLCGGSSALMTGTYGPRVSRLSDNGRNTVSAKLGLSWVDKRAFCPTSPPHGDY